MRRSLAIFLQIVIVLIGISTLGLMLWEPHLEGRNAHATLFQIYFNDPFLAYTYAASSAFFVALYQAFRLFGHIGQNEASSPASMKALRIIKYCAMALVVFIAGAEVYLPIAMRGQDDGPGGMVIGLFLMLISAAIAAAAAKFERTLQRAR